ncbi:bis(5'-nucleosyl)-tetraphosphatase (symmetrical) YqeK [Paenibacillus xylanilyticus]|uniref:bis(5'-nucleosyl)-tetraphosphatase (symmetrical) n=1 Tax=Paenibacillus xylanilyticus TaxID=248903 RepID=A0A7Y6C391_9BACL|nr:bis(5'-nucleosyl)-tetraphosphatase (symmetrical) YqeK [Paenibacillus xylanilyticus]NUU79770.1 HD domain-containing protein [Paenibacillus xylanilyticus]
MNPILKPYVMNVKLSNDLRNDIHSFFEAHHDQETLQHTLTVATEAKRVAGLFGAHPQKAEQAGLLHDISNVVPVNEMLNLANGLSIEILDEENKYDRIIHQKLSRAMAKEIFNINDQEILNAIECHTTLKPQSSLLDKVLFISDKISWDLPGEHNYLEEIRDKVNEYQLNEGILIYLNQVWEQRNKLKLVHPWLIEARDELLKVK